jgi:hypothetical protein
LAIFGRSNFWRVRRIDVFERGELLWLQCDSSTGYSRFRLQCSFSVRACYELRSLRTPRSCRPVCVLGPCSSRWPYTIVGSNGCAPTTVQGQPVGDLGTLHLGARSGDSGPAHINASHPRTWSRGSLQSVLSSVPDPRLSSRSLL